jgi:histidinol-phosphate/aromatic aminotransferase/cobyric acid decarboxylase-like protein
MTLPVKQQDVLLNKGFSRRQVGRIASLLTAGAALPFYNEFAMAQDAERRMMRGAAAGRMNDPDVVRISSNENPMGPCKEALESMAKIAPLAWRYSPVGEDQDFVKTVAGIEDVPADHIAAFAGSSDPLHRCQCAFTSPTHSWTMGDPGYGAGAPAFIGSALHQVPLRPDFSHDVEAMIKADPDGGVFYVCNPNNPSGTVTARKDIEYLLANKKKDSVVLIDEAYIHFSDTAQPSSDLVAADKDIIVLRTFSKVYGMAGIRAGFALGRPDLLAKMRPYGVGFAPVPITSMACATASLKVKDLVAKRKAINKGVRENTFAFLEKKGVKYIPSETNFFMMEVGKTGPFTQAMAAQKVIIGRVWNAWPTMVRVTVGTQDEMDKFKAAYEKVTA